MNTLKSHVLGILVLISIFTTGCVNSPAWPERDGSKILKRKGWSPSEIQLVLQGRAMCEEQWERLDKIRNENVVFLAARNPSIKRDRMLKYHASKRDFVRSGLAQNPAIPDDIIELLIHDLSHTVWVGLARNPSLDEATLLKLQRLRKINWSWFGLNPNCPPAVIKKMKASGEKNATYWLKPTRDGLRGWPVEKKLSRSERQKNSSS